MTATNEETADILQLSASEQLRLIGDGAISIPELAERAVALQLSRGAELGAIIDIDIDDVHVQAERLTEQARSDPGSRPLAGLIMTVKDSFDAEGLRTSHGRLSDSHIAAADAPVVRRLRAAGALVLGKTNVPVYLNDHQSSNDDFGVTRNPWDSTRSPGGSSGGSAAAVAAGLSATDLGSDLAGSLRIPASWCGLFGHKPSNGIVSKRAHLPWPCPGAMEPPVSTVGPLTRSARDLELILPFMLGVEAPEHIGWSVRLPSARSRGLRGLRVGVWLEDPYCVTDRETTVAIERFAEALGSEGARITALRTPPGTGAEGIALYARLQAAEVVHGFDDEVWASMVARSGSTSDPAAAFARLVVQSFRDGLAALEQQAEIVLRWQREVFSELDVVLCPAVPRAAPRLDDPNGHDRHLIIDDERHGIEQVGAWSKLVNLAKLPSTVVPLGRGASSGLPIGAQIVGPYLEDNTPIRVAVAAEDAGIIAYAPPPAWTSPG